MQIPNARAWNDDLGYPILDLEIRLLSAEGYLDMWQRAQSHS